MMTDPPKGTARFNPYTPPEKPTRSLSDDHRWASLDLFWTWEELRVGYNLILAAEVVLLFAIFWRTPGLSDILAVVEGAIGANLCFCAGPVLNAYMNWIGFRGKMVTGLLFLAGSGFAVLITLCALYSLWRTKSG